MKYLKNNNYKHKPENKNLNHMTSGSAFKMIIAGLFVTLFLSSCKNDDWSFPDYKYTAVYFAYQTPVKTLILGDDYMYDNSADNQHILQIYATMGGVYENNADRIIEVEIDNSLCENLYFSNDSTDKVLPMPSNYYVLPSKLEIVIPKGKLMGYLEIKLTDAFFNDSLSLKNKYVIPLVMKSVKNADSILQGKTEKTNPNRLINADWLTPPKDYTIYAVKFINPWHAYYLRRGINVVKGKNGNSSLDATYVYRAKYVEYDQVCQAISTGKNNVSISLITKADDRVTDVPFKIILTFDDNNNCTISSPSNAGYTATGSGKFVKDSEEWGGKKRNALYLKYDIEFENTIHSFTDTLVVRDRGIKMETFSPVILN